MNTPFHRFNIRQSITFAAFSFSLVFAGPQGFAEESESRVVAGMRSANVVIEELEHMVADLAGREESWENNIFPNIDIFLIGVDTEQPIRFDPIFSEQHGMELQPIIPLLDIDEFLEDNLDPIGIIPKRDRRDRDLYELTGNVFEGWLRVLSDPDYAVIFPRKEAIPKGMDHPAELHKDLVKKGYTFFAQLDNTKTEKSARQSAFEKMAKNTLDGIQKKPSETANAHSLRKAILDQQLTMIQQYFVEGSGLTLGSRLEKEKSTALFELLFTAVAETQLSQDIARAKTEPSYFAAVETPDDALLRSRLHLVLNESITSKMKEVYQLTETVAKEDLDANEEISDKEKTGRKNLAEQLNQVMTKSAELNVIDCFLDVVPTGEAHTFLLGIRCSGKEAINSALDEMVAAREEMKLTRDVAEASGTKIHKLDVGEGAPEVLQEMYGQDYHVVYLAVSDDAFWLAFGEQAQAELTKRMDSVASAEETKSDGVIFSMNAQVAPLVKSLNGLLSDENSLLGSFFLEQQSKRIEQNKQADEEKEEEDAEDRPAREAAQNFLTLEWVEKVIGTMDGEDDTVIFEMKVNDENAVVGTGEARKGILKAVGTLIANFADENLQ